jgi:hypothetical protein
MHAIAPFLCDAIVSSDQRYYMKTNSACKVHGTTFTFKDIRGNDIFQADGKLEFKKTKSIRLQFVPKMSGIYFTPNIRGFSQGDRAVAYLERRSKEMFKFYGYAPVNSVR